MWLTYQLACVFDVDAAFLPQHKEDGGAFAIVGSWLNLSRSGVESRKRKAEALRNTSEGMQDYDKWLNHRERRWWVYYAVRIENRTLKLLEYDKKADTGTVWLTPKEVENLVKEAERLVNAPGYEQDFEQWKVQYLKRDKKTKAKPLSYRSFPPDHPEAIASNERRKARGLKTSHDKTK